jgi:hypothetical protein
MIALGQPFFTVGEHSSPRRLGSEGYSKNSSPLRRSIPRTLLALIDVNPSHNREPSARTQSHLPWEASAEAVDRAWEAFFDGIGSGCGQNMTNLGALPRSWSRRAAPRKRKSGQRFPQKYAVFARHAYRREDVSLCGAAARKRFR